MASASLRIRSICSLSPTSVPLARFSASASSRARRSDRMEVMLSCCMAILPSMMDHHDAEKALIGSLDDPNLTLSSHFSLCAVDKPAKLPHGPALKQGGSLAALFFQRFLKERAMAKPATVKIRLVSSANTGFFYVTKKNPRTQTEKFTFRKYDPVARKHVEFKEAKIK